MTNHMTEKTVVRMMFATALFGGIACLAMITLPVVGKVLFLAVFFAAFAVVSFKALPFLKHRDQALARRDEEQPLTFQQQS